MWEHLSSSTLFGVGYALLLETARTGCGTCGLGSGGVVREAEALASIVDGELTWMSPVERLRMRGVGGL
jgi:hypothetical protein